MKHLIFVVTFLVPAVAGADLIILKDGTRLEGAIEGEMDGMTMVKTKYGALNIKNEEIASRTASEPPVAPVPAAEPVQPAVALSTASTPVQPAPEALPPEPPREPEHKFRTITLSTMAFNRVYLEDGVAIATETFDSKGGLLSSEGVIKDGAYREYYDNGNLKTEKTMINARVSGTLKAYYPTGVLQSEAYYLAGLLNGSVKIYGENSRLLFEQNFREGIPNGYFREFDETGGLKSELLYSDGQIVEKPKAAEPANGGTVPETAQEESGVTAKTQRLARGERFSFYTNGKFTAKLHLDKDFNIISRDGKVPDGTVKVYNKENKLEKELLFEKNELRSLKTYGENGALKGEYLIKERKALKK